MTLLLLALLGCPDPCGPRPEPTLTVGTGEEGFVPLDEVDHTLELVHGPQGGYHLLLGFEATGYAIDGLLAGSATGTVDGEVLATASPWLELTCDEATGTQRAAGLFLIYEAEPEELHLQTTQIEATLRDLDGRTATDEVEVTIFDPTLE